MRAGWFLNMREPLENHVTLRASMHSVIDCALATNLQVFLIFLVYTFWTLSHAHLSSRALRVARTRGRSLDGTPSR